MTTTTEAISVEELEEIFELVIPCGGNFFPRHRPCPTQAAATLVGTHQCDGDPKNFKCLRCYNEWLRAGEHETCKCRVCGVEMLKSRLYRTL